MRGYILGLGLLGFPAVAHAFCGVYVAGEGNEVENHASQVILAHHGGHTTLTIAADAAGDATDFGLLIPLPGDVDQEDITIADPALFGHLDAFTVPRQVQYTCPDVQTEYHATGMGCATNTLTYDDASDSPSSVEVEALFTVGEYEIAILHTTEAGAMQGWLDEHQFLAPEDPNGVLQRYIDGGNRFMAARVLLEKVSVGQEFLSPIQFTFEQGGDTLHLPIEIGTISATGPQEVVLYVISDLALGAARIENYPEVKPEDECMRPDDSDLTDYYTTEFDRVLGGEAGWTVEYGVQVDGMGGYHCDPCTTPQLDGMELSSLGWGGTVEESAFVTRLHMKYAPEQVHGDLDIGFDASNVALSQIRYIQYDRQLEYLYPVCGEGMRDEPGTCGDELTGSEKSCAVPVGSPVPVVALLIAGLGALRRRRR